METQELSLLRNLAAGFTETGNENQILETPVRIGHKWLFMHRGYRSIAILLFFFPIQLNHGLHSDMLAIQFKRLEFPLL